MKPVICNYYVTCRCNARCGFCSVWRENGASASEESSPAVVCRNLGDVKLLGVKIVDFTGGEPLLYEGLPQVLAYARNIGLRTTVTTNGIRYVERASGLSGLVDILQFSLDGADRATHDRVTGVPSFDRVMEGLEVARLLGERPGLIHTVTDENLGAVPDVCALARKLDVLLFLNPCFSYFGNGGLSREGALKLENMRVGSGVTIDRGFLKFLIDGGNKMSSPRCLAVSSTIVISPDDKLLLPCYHRKVRSVPINGRLLALRKSRIVHEEQSREGRYPFCEGCAINCYLRASLFRSLNPYFLPSLLSAADYLYARWRMTKSVS
ncbi:radical SAM protein [bacterium]|nr:radical SAM protein [bacterium]